MKKRSRYRPKGVLLNPLGYVLEGMKPSDKAVEGKKNDPMQALVWTREYKGESGKVSKVICTTMGASVDLESEGLRR